MLVSHALHVVRRPWLGHVLGWGQVSGSYIDLLLKAKHSENSAGGSAGDLPDELWGGALALPVLSMVDDLFGLEVDGDDALHVQLHLAWEQVAGHASLRIDDVMLVVHDLHLHGMAGSIAPRSRAHDDNPAGLGAAVTSASDHTRWR